MSIRTRSLMPALMLLTIAIAPAAAQQAAPADSAQRSRINRIFAAYDRTDSPGCAVGVYQGGKLAFARGYGLANLELGVAISPQSVFDLGSTSKQFTAMSVVLLAQQGKLSLDDEVRKYILELPDYGKRLTIRHILNHTSGLRDYLTLWDLAGIEDADLTTSDDALALIVRQKELNFAPGEQWLYSNSGFFLASVVVERVSGKTLTNFAQEHIFGPLGMRHTRFNDDHMSIIPNRATGYAPRAGSFATAMSNFEQTGDGAVQTSIEDLLLWDENFYSGRVGGSEGLKLMHTVAALNDGKVQTYALGLTVTTYRGLNTVSHGGSWAGYRAELMRFPEQHLAVACLCNVSSANPTALARQVAEVYLEDRMAAVTQSAPANPQAGTPAPPQAAPTPQPAQLDAFAGTYYSQELETTYRLSVEQGSLMLRRHRNPPTALRPISSDTFGLRSMQFRFTRERGRVTGFMVDAGRTRNLRFDRQ